MTDRIPERAKWIRNHPDMRASYLIQTPATGRPLMELGLDMAGIDRLTHYFYAGTPMSPTHLVWFVTQGQIKCDYGEGPKLVKEGEVVICPARTPHWIELASPRAKGLWFHFLDLKRWRFLNDRGACIRPAKEIVQLETLMEQCLVELNSKDPPSPQIAFHYCEIIALILTRELGFKFAPAHVVTHQRLEKLWAEVNANLKADWTVAHLAARLNISTGFLHKLALRHFSLRPMQMVLRLRMNRAMELLTHTNLSLEAIAEEIGYGTPYAFSNAFLRHVGMRPRTFRHR